MGAHNHCVWMHEKPHGFKEIEVEPSASLIDIRRFPESESWLRAGCHPVLSLRYGRAARTLCRPGTPLDASLGAPGNLPIVWSPGVALPVAIGDRRPTLLASVNRDWLWLRRRATCRGRRSVLAEHHGHAYSGATFSQRMGSGKTRQGKSALW